MRTMTKLNHRSRPTEHTEQVQFVTAVRQFFPHVLVFSIPNGGFRMAKEASRLKAEGVLPGVPDLFIPEARGRSHGLFIEMKRLGLTKSSLSSAQKSVHDQLRARGYAVAVCYGFEDAFETFKKYIKRGLHS